MIWFLSIAMLLTAIMYGYVAWRLHIVSPSLRLWVRLYLFIAWLTSITPLIFHYQQVMGDWVDILTWFVYLNMGFFSVLMVIYLVIDVLHLSVRPFKSNPERREFFKSSAAHMSMLGAAGIATGFGLEQAVGGAEIKEVHVPLGAPKALHDLKIVQFTDLHIGPMIKRGYVQTLVEQMNALDADIIVMTGDLVDGSVFRLQAEVAPLAKLKAKRGKYFITGNHEYYSGAEDWIAEMKRLGFTVLLNEHELIEVAGA